MPLAVLPMWDTFSGLEIRNCILVIKKSAKYYDKKHSRKEKYMRYSFKVEINFILH